MRLFYLYSTLLINIDMRRKCTLTENLAIEFPPAAHTFFHSSFLPLSRSLPFHLLFISHIFFFFTQFIDILLSSPLLYQIYLLISANLPPFLSLSLFFSPSIT